METATLEKPSENGRKSRTTWTDEMEQRGGRLFSAGMPKEVVAQNLGVSIATLRRKAPQFFNAREKQPTSGIVDAEVSPSATESPVKKGTLAEKYCFELNVQAETLENEILVMRKKIDELEDLVKRVEAAQ